VSVKTKTKSPPTDGEIAELCDLDLVAKLTRYAVVRHGYMERYELVSTTDDFVQEAFGRVLEGRRPWNHERYPTALEFMKGVVDSIAKDTRRSPQYQRDRSSRRVEVLSDTDGVQSLADASTTDAFGGEGLYEALLGVIKGDLELELVLEGRIDGSSRRDIAALLEITPDEVTNANKRLDRIIRKKLDWPAIKARAHGS
jgi:DNA-directed RNA polymerase specialized sigma24 family protein